MPHQKFRLSAKRRF